MRVVNLAVHVVEWHTHVNTARARIWHRPTRVSITKTGCDSDDLKSQVEQRLLNRILQFDLIEYKIGELNNLIYTV